MRLKKAGIFVLLLLMLSLTACGATAKTEVADRSPSTDSISVDDSDEPVETIVAAEATGDITEETASVTEIPVRPADVIPSVVEETSQEKGESIPPSNEPVAESQTLPSVSVAEAPADAETQPMETPVQGDKIPVQEETMMKIQITVGGTTMTAVPENNSSADAFLALLQEGPVTVSMSDYAGMEKVGPLGTSLPRNDSQISVGAGDVILYQGNQITIYYGTNSWSFTRLAHIEGATKESLLDVLGTGDVEVTFSILK